MRPRFLAVCALVSVAVVSHGRADPQSLELAQQLPQGANTIGILRLGDLLHAPRAEQEDWRGQLKERFLSGAVALPPEVQTLVVGSRLRPAIPEQLWTVVLLRLPTAVDMQAVAQQLQAPVQNIAGHDTVRSVRNAYVVQLAPEVLAAYHPPSRQETAMWLKQREGNGGAPLSSYLQSATDIPGHLVMAIDLTDMLDLTLVRKHLEEDQRFASHRAVIDRLVPLLGGLRGVTLNASVDEKTTVRIRIDLSAPPGNSALTIRMLFLSAIEDLGVSIEEFHDARVETEGNSVVLSCAVSDESLRRLLSLLTPVPTGAIASEPQVTQAGPQSEAGTPPTRSVKVVDPAQATKAYFDRVNQMVNDLEQANRRARDLGRTAGWYDNFARKIDALDTTGVDAAAVEYANRTSQRLRAIAASLRGQAIEVNAQQQTFTYNVHYDPGWSALNIWGGAGYRAPSYYVETNIQQIREKQAAAIAEGADERQQLWQMIHRDRAETAQRLKQP